MLAVAGAALLGGLGLAAPAAALPSVQPVAASVYTLSGGRIGASLAALLGLLGAVIGGLALARPTGMGHIGTGPGGTGTSRLSWRV